MSRRGQLQYPSDDDQNSLDLHLTAELQNNSTINWTYHRLDRPPSFNDYQNSPESLNRWIIKAHNNQPGTASTYQSPQYQRLPKQPPLTRPLHINAHTNQVYTTLTRSSPEFQKHRPHPVVPMLSLTHQSNTAPVLNCTQQSTIAG